ncbi:hypothetical protein [Actinoplanes sp. NPDC089786]|uniref:hypothetical protein n=1 Tax=Actinoplanes sp. NPDC089786 TaxID=3155185 RepID=UPI00341719A3
MRRIPTPRSLRRPGRWLTRTAAVAVLIAATGALSSAAPAAVEESRRVPGAAPRAEPGIPPACSAFHIPGELQQLGCAFVVGYANVNKLNGAVLLGVPDPGLVSVVIVANRSFCVPSTISLPLCVIRGGVRHTLTEYKFMLEPNGITPDMAEGEFPPAAQTLLTFGFMPVSAKMHLRQLGPISGTAETTQANGRHTLISTTLSGKVTIQLTDVKVNGVPMNTGVCHTLDPEEDNLHLSGSGDNSTIPPAGYTVARGGPLIGTTDIPPFTDCVGDDGEDLTPLFTASVSGPGNYTKMIQGNLCSPDISGANGCPPQIPVPER